MIPPVFTLSLGLLGLGGLGAILASFLGMPLPFVLGSLGATALFSIAFPDRIPAGYVFPPRLRLVFIALIGVLIGAQVTPAMLGQIPAMLASFSMLVVYVLLAHAMGYVLFLKLGRYDPATAFFCASPGGLYEAISLGEEAGADLALLTLQQFIRIILVITLLPLGLSLWMGGPVGSAGGQTLSSTDTDLTQLPWVIVAGVAGYGLGRLIRLPAAQLTGPLVGAALFGLFGGPELAAPTWLMAVAQVVIGASLGARFSGLDRYRLVRALGLGVVSVLAMLILAAVLIWPLIYWGAAPFDVMLISFAPGGITEMALVALSLSASPAYVTVHHVFRILITVLEMTLVARWRFPPQTPL